MRVDEQRMLHLQAHLDHLEGKWPLPKPIQRGKKRGTFNHEFLLRVGLYADGQDGAREQLLEWLRSQEKEGHCSRGAAIETNSASHCQLNEAAAGVGLVFAVENADLALEEAFRDWWWAEMVLSNETAIPGRETKPFDNKKGERQPDVWGPGWRAMQKTKLIGSNACRDLCWRLIMGHPAPSPKHRLWKSRYYLAARALRMLPEIELRALRPAPGFQPPLPYPLRVAHWNDGGFHAEWEVPAAVGGDFARWAGWTPGEEPRLGLHPAFPDTVTRISYYPGLRPLAQGDGPA